jgi:hypothetical protein
MKWGVLTGNWGDVICSLAFFQQEIKSGGIIYYGHLGAAMVEFLMQQDGVQDVKLVPYSQSIEVIRKYRLEIIGRKITEETKVDLIKGLDIAPEDVTSAYVDHEADALWEAEIPHAENLKLPDHVTEWAQDLASTLPKPLVMIQPYSVNTNGIWEHWPYWRMLLRWIIGDQTKHFLICGKGWDTFRLKGLSNVTCLVDRTPSQMHVFALAEHCESVISTTNSLAHWCIAKKIKSVFCAARYDNEPQTFWYKALRAPTTRVFTRFTAIARVAYGISEFLDIWPQPNKETPLYKVQP